MKMMVANSFDLWQKDAFFSAAEEVQESADMYVCLSCYGILGRGCGLFCVGFHLIGVFVLIFLQWGSVLSNFLAVFVQPFCCLCVDFSGSIWFLYVYVFSVFILLVLGRLVGLILGWCSCC